MMLDRVLAMEGCSAGRFLGLGGLNLGRVQHTVEAGSILTLLADLRRPTDATCTAAASSAISESSPRPCSVAAPETPSRAEQRCPSDATQWMIAAAAGAQG